LVVASPIALFYLLFVSAEDWWPMGRRIPGFLLVIFALALAVSGFGYIWTA
jgi:hypothetical protein